MAEFKLSSLQTQYGKSSSLREQTTMATKNELLSALSEAEQFALYGWPDFDDRQRLDYLALSESEPALASSRPTLAAKAYRALQIGYFKAKHAFFRFTWGDVQEDCAFVLTRYFNDHTFERHAITKHEHYKQRTMIAELFGYRLWSADFFPQLAQKLAQIVRRDATLGFIVAEFIAYLNEHKIVRPGHTTLQTLISEALSAERRRLGELLAEVVDGAAKDALTQLLVRDDTLSELAALKQDAKDFGWRQMAQEREKRARLEPFYRIAKTLLPQLAVSQQNLHYYASLANFYTVYDLRRLVCCHFGCMFSSISSISPVGWAVPTTRQLNHDLWWAIPTLLGYLAPPGSRTSSPRSPSITGNSME
jgi:hypothetical protein